MVDSKFKSFVKEKMKVLLSKDMEAFFRMNYFQKHYNNVIFITTYKGRSLGVRSSIAEMLETQERDSL